MVYLVDGNNVMALKPGWYKDKAAARRRLIYELSALVATRRVKVRVVFDGAPDELFPDGATYKSVHIFYAKHGSNADTRIKDMVRRSSFKRDMVVVSSDRDLSSFARRQGTKIMTSGQFRRMINAARASRAEQEPSREDSPVDVDEWMDYFHHSES